MNTRLPLAFAAILAVGTLPLAACETNRHSIADDTAGIDLSASASEIVVGETVTFVARTNDTYGRDADIEWSATSGDLKKEQNGRVARVTFKEVGTYTVRATLSVDGREVAQDLAEVKVKALR